MSKIKISVFVLSYNHADYIRDTFEGIVNQELNVPFQVFVYDDASTDGTDKIIQEYAKRYSGLFTTHLSRQNMYSCKKNYSDYLRDVSRDYMEGEYIAWCEGDDYWTDNNKLQIQLDYMETHKDCFFCACASQWENYETGNMSAYHPYDCDKDLSVEDIIIRKKGNISTASTLMRRDIWFKDNNFPSADVGDVINQMYAMTKGKIHYIDREMCVYRYRHPGSWESSYKANFESRISHAISMSQFLEEYDDYTGKKYHYYVKKKWCEYLFGIIDYHNITNEEYEKCCMRILTNNLDTNIGNKMRGLLSIRKAFYHEDACFSESIIERINGKRIVVFGTGNYSFYVERMLANSNVELDGYLVSDTSKSKNNKKLPVWDLEHYSYSYEDTVIIIGVNQIIEDEITRILITCSPYLVLAPLWFGWSDSSNEMERLN